MIPGTLRCRGTRSGSVAAASGQLAWQSFPSAALAPAIATTSRPTASQDRTGLQRLRAHPFPDPVHVPRDRGRDGGAVTADQHRNGQESELAVQLLPGAGEQELQDPERLLGVGGRFDRGDAVLDRRPVKVVDRSAASTSALKLSVALLTLSPLAR